VTQHWSVTFQEAASWDRDRTAMNERSVRIAWRVCDRLPAQSPRMAVAALMLLMPLKRVDPFRDPGLITAPVSSMSLPVFTGNTEMSETVTRYFLDHYVTVCEAFQLLDSRERLRGMRELPCSGPQQRLVCAVGSG